MRSHELFELPLLALSAAVHFVFFWAVDLVPIPERDDRQLVEFEVAELPEPRETKEEEKKPEPKPEPEPEPEPDEPEPEPEPIPEIKPKVDPKPKPPKPPPPEAAPPPKFRLPPSQLVPAGQGSGVSIEAGESQPQATKTSGQDNGRRDGKIGGTGTGPADSTGTGSGPPKKPWEPTSELYIRALPTVEKDPPKLQCPATRDGVAGIIVLTIQLHRDGTMRHIKVSKGIGHGCDEIAVKALKKAKFRPAIATNGKPADYELRWEYEFRSGD